MDSVTLPASLVLARRMLGIFQGRADVFATAWEREHKKGFAFACDAKFSASCRIGKVSPHPCTDCAARSPSDLTEDVLRRHVQGEHRVGVYLLVDGKVKMCCVDLDDHNGAVVPPEQTPLAIGGRIVDAARSLGLTMFLERSAGGRGAHVWLFFNEWVKAAQARRLMELLKQLAKAPADAEVFPKQRDADVYGSLIALPWFGGPPVWAQGKGVVLDHDTLDPLRGDPVEVCALIEDALATEFQIAVVLRDLKEQGIVAVSRDHAPAAAVPHRIPEGQRNSLLTSLAGTMRRRGLSPEAIEAALLVENEKRCDPPLDSSEVSSICASVGTYAPAAAAVATVPADAASGLSFDAKGYPHMSGSNVSWELLNSPHWKGCVAYNGFHCRPYWVKAPPFPASHGLVPVAGEMFQDTDYTYIAGWLERTTFKSNRTIAKAAMVDGVDSAAKANYHHPIRDYLRSVAWDKTPRVDSWLTTYLGSPARGITSAIGRWWLMSAVARVMRPGCKADYVMVLEGDQGAKKSTALQVLGGEWYSASMGDLRNKDSAENLQGVWVMEIGELDAIRGSARTRVKDFITKPFDMFRPAYGHHPVKFMRQCVFAGSTNETKWLADETGGRRFWPVPVTDVNLPALTASRDQLWAEATVLFDSGLRWWPDSELEHSPLREIQEDRFEVDAWEPVLEEWLAKAGPAVELTTANILGFAVFADQHGNARYDHIGRAEEMKCSGIMRRLGYVVSREGAGDRRRIWRKI